MSTVPPKPVFKNIAATLAAVAEVAHDSNVPTMVHPKETGLSVVPKPEPAAEPAKESPRKSRRTAQPAPLHRFTINVPDYVNVSLATRCAEEQVTKRFFILDALRKAGIPVNEVDLIEDRRRED